MGGRDGRPLVVPPENAINVMKWVRLARQGKHGSTEDGVAPVNVPAKPQWADKLEKRLHLLRSTVKPFFGDEDEPTPINSSVDDTSRLTTLNPRLSSRPGTMVFADRANRRHICLNAPRWVLRAGKMMCSSAMNYRSFSGVSLTSALSPWKISTAGLLSMLIATSMASQSALNSRTGAGMEDAAEMPKQIDWIEMRRVQHRAWELLARTESEGDHRGAIVALREVRGARVPGISGWDVGKSAASERRGDGPPKKIIVRFVGPGDLPERDKP